MAVVYLCPIAGHFPDRYDVSKKYLKYLTDKGKLRIDFLHQEDGIFTADVYIRSKLDRKQELYLNREMINKGMATVEKPISPACSNSELSKSLSRNQNRN